MNPYSADLPLRTTAVWGAFRDLQVIPHRYGDTAGELIPYDEGRRVFVWADHASVEIRDVLVEGQSVFNWAWRNGQDSTGRSVTFVEFSVMQDEGAQLTAQGLAKADTRTGALITNPADVLFDILAGIAGHAVTTADLDLFRAECATRGLAVAGSLDQVVSTQRAAAAVCESIGAVFCPTMEGIARLYPGGHLEAFTAARITGDLVAGASCNLDAIATAVVINFDWQDDKALQSIEVDAPDAIEEYGRREFVLDAHWLSDPRGGYDVAVRMLRQFARPVWNVTASGVRPTSRLRRLAVGQTVEVDHPSLPVSGAALVLSCESDPFTDYCAIAVEIPAGVDPRVRLVRTSVAFDPLQYAAAAIITQGSSRVVTLNDADGTPLTDARVTLNGGITVYSDSGGRCLFAVSAMPPGTHTLLITASDGQEFETQVVVA